jgi:hypothetical protein
MLLRSPGNCLSCPCVKTPLIKTEHLSIPNTNVGGKDIRLRQVSLYQIYVSLYTILPHDKLKIRLKETIHKAFSHRNYGSKFVVLGYNSTYFSNKIQKCKTCYSEEQVISMLEFLIDNIFVSFGGTLFQQVVGIPMG